jgi:putative cell wall-binding protein
MDIILQFRYTSKEFYAVSYELAGVLGALDSIPTTSDLADVIDKIVWKPVQTLDGDPYTITADQVLAKYPESEKVIIARGDLGADSLASVAYARALGVPILLVKPGEIPGVTSDALAKLNTKSTIVLGGPVAVSEEVKERLPRATRIWGENRHETAVKMAEALMAQQSVDTVIVTDGINPDIMAVMIAMKYGAPIIYTAGDEITPETESFLEQNKFKRVVIIGTTADINATISQGESR